MQVSGAEMENTSMWSSVGAFKRATVGVAVAAGLVILTMAAPRMAAPHFYSDDPLWVDDDQSHDASSVVPIGDSNLYDFVVNTFGQQASRAPVRAENVNSVDEVPDSSWFVNRIGRRDMSIDEIVRGTDRFEAITLDGWQVSGGKSSGVTPGFQMVDRDGHPYQIKFDPPANPEMSSAAEIIGADFYHAFGYNTVDGYLAELDPERLTIREGARIWDPLAGKKRPLEMRDVHEVLRRAARQPNGNYRVLASRYADGKPLGNFRYYRQRPDDPNDLVAHENRRELRGSRVFGAWLNHVDSRGINSLDMLVENDGRSYIKHYMFDFGATLGSGTLAAQARRVGNEYILEWKPGWLTLATLGFYTRPWMHIDYPRAPAAVGRFEATAFEPVKWKPEYPNPAFDSMRPDDAFWAARIVAKFNDRAIRAIVEKAHYSDPQATDYVIGTIIKRRDKVLSCWLTQVNPLVDFALSDRGELTFGNAAEQAGVATAADGYRVQWARFDNTTGIATDVGESATVSEPRAEAPAALLASGTTEQFVQVSVAAIHPKFPTWETPVTVHFKRGSEGEAWKLVGLVRLPDVAGAAKRVTTSENGPRTARSAAGKAGK
jgi:hypothetical protein